MTTAFFSCLIVLIVTDSKVEARLNDAHGSSAEANAAAGSVRIIAKTSGTLLSSADGAVPCRSVFAVAPQPMQVGALTMERPRPIIQQAMQLPSASTVINLPVDAAKSTPRSDMENSSPEEVISYTPNLIATLDDFDTVFDVQPVPEPSTWIAGAIALVVAIGLKARKPRCRTRRPTPR